MAQEFQTIGLIGRKKIKKHEPFLNHLMEYLKKKNRNVIWDDHLVDYYGKEHERGPAYILNHAHLVITLGGDGTILKLVRDLPKRKKLYVFGVNLGNVGFLTEVKQSEKVFEMLDEFFQGKYHIDERLVLRVTQYRNAEKLSTHLALNEAVINQGNFARLIGLNASIDQRKMISFKADGVILASPTGSTGHSLSAGGPILHPRVDAFVFAPICPSELSVRPIVIPSDRQITITVDTDRKFKDNKIGLTIDGQIVLPLEYGDKIKVRKSSRKLRFIRKQGSGQKYYRLLRDKLSWGRRG
ncbi:MAG: NAD+ kinase [Oceanicoccus sp.]|jgi:NAD+ kinase